LTDTISYRQTACFSAIVSDYTEGSTALEDFYAFPVNANGLKQAIEARRQFPVDRQLLVKQLQTQYATHGASEKQQKNIEALLSENTFTICTAHQPNIFTGRLYFIYKILHAIKLADQLNQTDSKNHFVPVFFMGSEDADLEELGQVTLNGLTYKWNTSQTGAVGRMKVDQSFLELIHSFKGQLEIFPFGKSAIDLVLDCYQLNESISQATFKMINRLFSEYGLLVIVPDHPELKKAFVPVLKKELCEQFSHKNLIDTRNRFPKTYPAQSFGRPLNLFYLKDDRRERIEKVGDQYRVVNMDLSFTETSILNELELYPDRFSPNVILRPLFQECILPNIVFVGGGSEIAYWLELKDVFQSARAFFPMLVLRNSFLLMDSNQLACMRRFGFASGDLFSSAKQLADDWVRAESKHPVDLKTYRDSMVELYRQMEQVAESADTTLVSHIKALHAAADKRLIAAEKKLLRAEKRKFSDSIRQIEKLKATLFPNKNLQEREENFFWYYSRYGSEIIKKIYNHSFTFEQLFTLLHLDK